MCSIKQNKIKEIIQSSIAEISNFIDANTIIGTPMSDKNGAIIIPFSQVNFISLSGGGEFGKINVFNKGNAPLGVGNGAVVSIKPSGFIIKEGSSDYKILSVPNGPYETIIEKVSEFASEIKKEKNEKN